MELIRKHAVPGGFRYLLETDPDPKTGVLRGLIADLTAQTVVRVPNLAAALKPGLPKAQQWQALGPGDPDLDQLTAQLPALRRHRGIEIRLPPGVTAWVLWGRWSSTDESAATRLSEASAALVVPAYEPDRDYFLASSCAARFGGAVLDPPRSIYSNSNEAY